MNNEFEEKKEFTIKDDGAAEWAIEKIAETNAETDRLIELAKSKIEVLKQQITEFEQKRDNDNSYLTSKLAEYFDTVPHKKTTTQEQYKLLSGSLIRKKVAPKYNYEDTDLLDYLCANSPELVDTVQKPKWGEFKKRIVSTDNGQLIDGETGEFLSFIEAIPQADKFEVKI